MRILRVVADLAADSSVPKAFTRDPDIQINAWRDEPSDSVPHYGASFLFQSYFLERFGDKLSVCRRESFMLASNDTGQFEPAPTNSHDKPP